MYAKVYPESTLREKEHFICLTRTEIGEFGCYRVFYVKSFSEIIQHNNATSIVVSYCENCSRSSVEQFNKMNKRFMSPNENFFGISYDFFVSYINYLTKYKGIQKKQIWINSKYQITEYNTELFCGMNFDIRSRENDNISVTTHTVDDVGYDSDN